MENGMTFSGLDTVFYTLAFLVPGFIIGELCGRFYTEDETPTHLLLLRFLTFSCLNYAVWFLPIYLMLRLDFFLSHPILTGIAWFVIMFVSPVVIGCFIGLTEQKGKLHDKLAKWGIKFARASSNTAWDDAFEDHIQGGRFVTITLRDETVIQGYVGEGSYVTRLAQGGDLYINLTCKEDWKSDDNSRGAWIKGEEIRYIEFWDAG